MKVDIQIPINIIKNKREIDGKGRSIVLNKDVKHLSIHEVFPDLINAEIDKNKGMFIKRGNFKSLEKKLDELHNRFINCLYIFGALERDNNIIYDEENGKPIDIGNPNASPMSITNRASVSSLLGGVEDFKSLINKAKSLNMKVIIDSLCRISSSNFNTKYRNVLLRYIDERNKLQSCYGSVGKSTDYKESTILNYRKIEAWEILVNEIKTIIKKFNIDGIHLDNCQMWPNIMELNIAEMYRVDNDGILSYSPLEILNGEIIMPNSESGYWDSDNCEQYPNPLLVKLTKEIWEEYPEFIFIGECGLEEKFPQPYNRHESLVKSGIIPRMYTLPAIICQMIGKKITYNGNIESVPPENVSIFKEWYEEHYQNLPEGAILVQSSGGQIWPYPALLYGRGNSIAIDLLFTLRDVPITFMNEIDGEAYRVKIINIYTSRENKNNNQENKIITRSNSLNKLFESMLQEAREREEEQKNESSKLAINDFLATSFNTSEYIYSIINLSDVNIKNSRDIDTKQNNLVQSLKQQGFDLTKIRYRYDKIRQMRQNHKCLKDGELVFLNVYDNNNNLHPGILAFARKTAEETGIFAINFRDKETNFFIDLSNLFGKDEDSFSIYYIEDWTSNNKGVHYFFKDIIKNRINKKIGPYDTTCIGLNLVPSNEENYQKVMEINNSKTNTYNELILTTFSIKFENRKQPKTVLLCGSFSNWKEKIPLDFNPFNEKWSTELSLPKGKHLYKYIIDNNWEINPSERYERGNDGFENNVLIL